MFMPLAVHVFREHLRRPSALTLEDLEALHKQQIR
jgi:hypothetical protein